MCPLHAAVGAHRDRGAPARAVGGIRSAEAIVSAGVATAVAGWLVPASVQIVNWPARGPARVAYFAPLARLWWLIGIVAVAAGLSFALARISARPDHRAGKPGQIISRAEFASALERIAHIIAPLQWLWLWTIPFWPVVPDRLPLLLVLGGPVRWVIAAACLIAAAARIGRRRALDTGDGRTSRPTPRRGWPRLGRGTVFALSLATYLLAGSAWNADLGFSGDEPHYLVIAHSLVVDHDLNIENNHARRDYASFYAGTLRPDYLARGRHGEIYSVHAPGLPALLAPVYAVAGARGAVALLAIIAALTAVAIFDSAVLAGGLAAGWLTWAAVCLTVPFLPHAWLIYPELPAALIVAWAVRWLVAPPSGAIVRWLARGAALAVLPWLHTKYTVLLAPLALFVAIDLWQRSRRSAVRLAIAFGVPIAVSLTLWFVSFLIMYGALDPQAAYGSYPDAFVRSRNIARGVLGLLIDQKFGLLVYAPVYLLAGAGALTARRSSEHRLATAAAIVTTAIFALSTARFYMWWGGASAPARFLVPILPLLALMLARAAGSWRRTFMVALAASVAVAVLTLAIPSRAMLLSDPHGESRLLTWLQGAAPLTSAWPTLTEPEWRPQFARAARALAGRFDTTARAETVSRGREALLAAFDGDRLRAFDYVTYRRADRAFVISRTALRRSREDGELNDDPARLAGPFDLAAGEYAVRLWFAGPPAPAFVHYHRGPALATFEPSPTGEVAGVVRLPVDAPVIWIGVGSPQDAARAQRVDVVPISIVPRSARLAVDPVAIEPLAANGLLIYADRNSYPEGGVFWTRGKRQATVYVAVELASRLTARVHTGPAGGSVWITFGGESRTLILPPNGTADVSVPGVNGTVIPITIRSTDSFVPSITDPHSDDSRELGCQVRILLS